MSSSFINTLRLSKADLFRRLVLEGKSQNYLNCLLILYKRGVVSVLLYRLKRYLFLNNLAFLIKPLTILDTFYTHSELDVRAEIAGGLVLNDLGGVGLTRVAIVGKNCTLMGRVTVALGAIEGINFDVDRIKIGDNCVIGHNVKFIRPLTIANCVQIKSNSIVIKSVDTAGSIISGIPARSIDVVGVETVMAWNPLLSHLADMEACDENLA